MRAIILIVSGCLPWGLSVSPARAEGKPDRTPEMQKVAQAFVKAYQAKDLNALMETVDAPFFVGTLRDSRTMKKSGELRAELKSRLPSAKEFPTRVVKVLTWEQAISPLFGTEDQKKTRRLMKPAIDATGEDGGYAALGDLQGTKRKLMAISNTRLLVGIRDGEAKVVGILIDDPGVR